MYYEHGYKQARIGMILECSAMEVSRLLRGAREHNIVQIRINRQQSDDLEHNLVRKFKLLEVRLSPHASDPEESRRLLAAAAAQYFNDVLQDHLTVGLSGGRTLHKMVEMITSERRQITIYPLTGIWRELQINYVDSGVLVHSLWSKCRDAAEAFWFPIEPLKNRTSKSIILAQRRKYLNNSQVKTVYSAAKTVDLAFLGVGPLRKNSSTIKQLQNIGITYEYLKNVGAVGIAGGVWYNHQAEAVVKDYFLSVPITAFSRLSRQSDKRVVIVAGGDEKLNAIRVLLDKRVCNVLITDTRTAALLSD